MNNTFQHIKKVVEDYVPTLTDKVNVEPFRRTYDGIHHDWVFLSLKKETMRPSRSFILSVLVFLSLKKETMGARHIVVLDFKTQPVIANSYSRCLTDKEITEDFVISDDAIRDYTKKAVETILSYDFVKTDEDLRVEQLIESL